MVILGDSRTELKKFPSDSIDAVITDPPYGYSFMGKDWDKAVPSVEIWRECLRVLKPGAFCMVMSAPRSDVQNAMISRLMEAGFRLDFTPIYWTYASGFPKAGNIGKLIDKRLGLEREVIGIDENWLRRNPDSGASQSGITNERHRDGIEAAKITVPASPEAKKLNGSYAGFQPKPAVEVIIVAMKPLSEKTFVDQALKNGKGITWLDDARIPVGGNDRIEYGIDGDEGSPTVNDYGERKRVAYTRHEQGRFPANLLVSNDVLNDGTIQTNRGSRGHTDSGTHSRYFDLDKWAQTLPFLIATKASKSEKNKGLDSFEEKQAAGLPMRSSSGERGGVGGDGTKTDRTTVTKNHHPTVKPLKLMSYLITLTTRQGDTVLDPFAGSGTTIVAAELLGRLGIGIELSEEYTAIAKARLEDAQKDIQTSFFG